MRGARIMTRHELAEQPRLFLQRLRDDRHGASPLPAYEQAHRPSISEIDPPPGRTERDDHAVPPGEVADWGRPFAAGDAPDAREKHQLTAQQSMERRPEQTLHDRVDHFEVRWRRSPLIAVYDRQTSDQPVTLNKAAHCLFEPSADVLVCARSAEPRDQRVEDPAPTPA